MMPGDDEDEDLLARLNALRTTSVSLKQNHSNLNPASNNTNANASNSPEHDLVARFGKLGGSIAPNRSGHDTGAFHEENGDTEKNEEDDQTLEELMEELKGSEAEWELDKGEKQTALDLLGEAEVALKEAKTDNVGLQASDGQKREEGTNSHAGTTATAANGTREDKEPQMSEEEEADGYIQRALEEASLQGVADIDDKPPSYEQSTKDAQEQDVTTDDPFSNLPSVPEDLPATPQKDPGQDGLFPSAPSFKPSDKKSPKSKLPTFTDEDIESWCIICNDDATLKCLGCDGDLYCLTCWNEGHTGPDAGYEEKRHRCVQYSRKSAQAAA